jgi:4-hydroxy-tetrahydrodipicolinate reductase
MTKIILNGCNGKMGQAITALAIESDSFSIVAGIDVSGKGPGEYPIFTEPSKCDIDADVIIDFSRPEALQGVIKHAREKKLALVVATTGLDDTQINMLTNLSKEVPVLVSGNMSLGVNLLLDLAKRAAIVLEEDFDIEIIEKHHNMKVDAPSGTALMIADEINESLNEKKNYVYGRQSKSEKRDKKEMGIHSLRGGTIVGEHSIIFSGYNEIIEIKHTALSREIFANGALRAGLFLATQKPGLYSMKDIVNN